MQIKLHPPFIISSRLMPGIRVGDAVISVHKGGRNKEGRTVYDAYIDLAGGYSHHVTDIRSGRQGGTLLEGFTSLLSFLGAAAESIHYAMRTGKRGENHDLFPVVIMDWAYQNSDEIAILQIEIGENPQWLTETPDYNNTRDISMEALARERPRFDGIHGEN